MTQRTEDLAAARRLLLALSEGLSKVGKLLFANGLVYEGRAVKRIAAEVAEMRRTVRTAHNAALTAESGSGTFGENR